MTVTTHRSTRHPECVDATAPARRAVAHYAIALLTGERLAPWEVAIVAVELAARAVRNGQPPPPGLWAAGEPIHDAAHAMVDEIAAQVSTNAAIAHAQIAVTLLAAHAPVKHWIQKDTFTDRRWWARRVAEQNVFLWDSVPAARPSAPLTLFRGAPASRRAGLFWTDTRRLAARYGPVWTVTVPGAAVLSAYRDIHTYDRVFVLDPSRLGPIRLARKGRSR